MADAGSTAPVGSQATALANPAAFRTFFDVIDDFLFVIDWHGQIVHVNPAVRHKLGYLDDELIGRNVLELHPAERRAEAAVIVSEMQQGLRQFCPIPLLARDGRQFPVETRVYPGIWNDEPALFGISRDLTELQASEERFSRIFSLTPVAMVLSRLADARIVAVNPAFEVLIGYRAEEAIGRTTVELGLFPDLTWRARAIAALQSGETVDGWEFPLQARDGRRLIGLFAARFVQIQAEALLLTSMIDLTATRRTELSLAHEQRRLNALIESIPDLVWLKDQQGVYLSCNRRFARYLGRSRAAIVGQTDHDLREPDQAERCRIRDQAVLDATAPVVSEVRLRFANDGHEEWVEIIQAAVCDEAGERIGVLGIGRDISERKAREEAAQLLASVFSATRDGILICGPDERILDVNPAFTRITGYRRDEALGQTPRFLSSGRQGRDFYAAMWQSIARDGYWKGELWNRNQAGDCYAVRTNIAALRDPRGQVTHYIGVFSDITALKLQQAQLTQLAHHDALTQLPNRYLLSDRLDMALSRARRHDSSLAVCFLDLDRFKPINDRFGHDAGDMVLIEIARRIAENVRQDDTVARLGGDEFVILLNEVEDDAELHWILERLLARIGDPIALPGGAVQVQASIGVTWSDRGQKDGERLLHEADQAMYRAKRMGCNCYHVCDRSASTDTPD